MMRHEVTCDQPQKQCFLQAAGGNNYSMTCVFPDQAGEECWCSSG
jgi:hypothetical protein